jgi:hypothetical protein
MFKPTSKFPTTRSLNLRLFRRASGLLVGLVEVPGDPVAVQADLEVLLQEAARHRMEEDLVAREAEVRGGRVAQAARAVIPQSWRSGSPRWKRKI